jgi:hypothetical protein
MLSGRVSVMVLVLMCCTCISVLLVADVLCNRCRCWVRIGIRASLRASDGQTANVDCCWLNASVPRILNGSERDENCPSLSSIIPRRVTNRVSVLCVRVCVLKWGGDGRLHVSSAVKARALGNKVRETWSSSLFWRYKLLCNINFHSDTKWKVAALCSFDLYTSGSVTYRECFKNSFTTWKLIWIYSEDIYSIFNCHNITRHTDFYSSMWLPLVVQSVSKRPLQCYSKCLCYKMLRKHLHLRAYKLFIVQHLDWWMACTLLS